MIIRKGDILYDESGDLRYIKIEGRHFDDYAVSIWEPRYDSDGEMLDDWAHDHDAIFTANEIRTLANAKEITYVEEEEA